MKSILFLLLFIFSFPLICNAQEFDVKFFKSGQAVTMDAMCFSLSSAVKLKYDLEFCAKEEQLICEKNTNLLKLDFEKEKKILEISYNADIEKKDFKNKILEEEILKLSKDVAELEKDSKTIFDFNWFWYASGIITAVSIGFGVQYFLNL